MILQLISIFVGTIVLGVLLNVLDYRFMKSRYLKSEKFDLNICCGNTSCNGVNVDIVKRNVHGFVLVDNINKLPFKDKQFKNAICSHTMEHVDDPEKFFKELKRVSKNVTLLVPPLWDFGCILNIFEHKRQFITLSSKHKNHMPKSFNLPLAKTYQTIFGQRL